jgi:hypothetical protein
MAVSVRISSYKFKITIKSPEFWHLPKFGTSILTKLDYRKIFSFQLAGSIESLKPTIWNKFKRELANLKQPVTI